MLFSPLEQFDVIPLLGINIFSLNLSFTNVSLYMVFSVGTFLTLVYLATSNATIIPKRWQLLVEMTYEVLLSLVTENVGEKGKKYFPFVYTLFIFLLMCNLLGMIPYSFTVTSHVAITFGLSLSIFIAITLIGFMTHGIHFMSFFLPAGSPPLLALLLVPIELLSYLSRAFSLAIRLFANMMSGHTLLKIMSGFAWTMLSIGGIFYVIDIMPIGLLFLLSGLELGIAFLQAYVFTILVCIYLNDVIYLSH